MQLIELDKFFNLIGTFWSKLTASTTLTKRLFTAVLQLHRQSEQKATELVKAVSNVEIPAGQTTVIEKLVFINNAFPALLYGTGEAKYGSNYFYGDVLDNKAIYAIPDNIISIPIMYDNPVNPTKIYTENVDYVIEPGKITFRQPFDTNVTTLYGKYILRDTGFVYRQLGYVIGVNLSDKLFAKVPLKEFWRLYSYGPNYQNTLQIIGLCARAPIIKHAQETVEKILNLIEGKFVITDKEVYFVEHGKNVTVKTGAVLTQGTSISSGLEVLHDKFPIISNNLPNDMRINNYLRYGNKIVNPARVILIKADIQGDAALALQYFVNIMPLDIKVILFTNVLAPSLEVASNTVSFNINQTFSVRAPAYSAQNLEITSKCEFRLKYSA